MSKWKPSTHPWRVGELCTCVYDNVGHGIIYRVAEVHSRSQHEPMLKVVPVFGVLTNIKGRKSRGLSAGYCTPLSLVDLSNEYLKFGHFIAAEAKDRGAEPSTTPEKVPTGNIDDFGGRPSDDDGGGLCADISSRDEELLGR